MRRSGGGIVRTLIFGGLLAVIAYAVVAAIGLELLAVPDHGEGPLAAADPGRAARAVGSPRRASAVRGRGRPGEGRPLRAPAIAGERVQFVAVGTVDAVVDLTRLPTDAVRYDAETDSAVVYLPRPTIAEPVLDLDQSHVMNRDRGLLNRLGGMLQRQPDERAGLQEAPQDKMADAAAQTELVAKAEEQAGVAARAARAPARGDHRRGPLLRRRRAARLRAGEVLLTPTAAVRR